MQGELGAKFPAKLAFNAVSRIFSDLPVFRGDMLVECARDILRRVARPAFNGIESNDALHLAVLTGEAVVDQGNV